MNTQTMALTWENCFTAQRSGMKLAGEGPRSDFQRDYDRIIFSSPFRRLQNKTQVFPLPGSVFVHNRLTHSLEVASVGRSLGSMVGKQIAEQFDPASEAYEFYKFQLGSVISAACLAHDIGNPAFGHSGESAISSYFLENAAISISGQKLRTFFSDNEWQDLTNFEGNANAIRILTGHFKGRMAGGLQLTNTTLAAIAKYPCPSIATDKKLLHRKKFGFFQSEKDTFKTIAESTNMIVDESQPTGGYKRHPFVFLVEAADDICYRIIDVEDAHRLRILPFEWVKSHLVKLIVPGLSASELSKFESNLDELDDPNELVGYLRAKAIGTLIKECAAAFLNHEAALIKGTLQTDLVESITGEIKAVLEEIKHVSIDKIYHHPSVVEIEVAGFHVLSGLLALFVPAALKEHPDTKDKMVIRLLPDQFNALNELHSPYEKVLCVLDHVSSMTDIYATELYRRLTGIDTTFAK